jgi:hypothetical protein
MQSFWAELRTQRWDDHRYYHHSRINQSLHLLSAVSFIIAYITAFTDPAKSALIGWLVAMVSRQSGHFFFEPKGYDEVNRATHEHKEDIKVGYNLRRKVILHLVWALSPAVLWLDDVFRAVSAARRRRGIRASRGRNLAHRRHRRARVPHGALVLFEGRANRAGLADQDHHGPVQRREDLLQGAPLLDARRTDRSHG